MTLPDPRCGNGPHSFPKRCLTWGEKGKTKMRSVCFHQPVKWRGRQAGRAERRKDNCVSPVCPPLRMHGILNDIKEQRSSSSSGNVLLPGRPAPSQQLDSATMAKHPEMIYPPPLTPISNMRGSLLCARKTFLSQERMTSVAAIRGEERVLCWPIHPMKSGIVLLLRWGRTSHPSLTSRCLAAAVYSQTEALPSVSTRGRCFAQLGDGADSIAKTLILTKNSQESVYYFNQKCV